MVGGQQRRMEAGYSRPRVVVTRDLGQPCFSHHGHQFGETEAAKKGLYFGAIAPNHLSQITSGKLSVLTCMIAKSSNKNAASRQATDIHPRKKQLALRDPHNR